MPSDMLRGDNSCAIVAGTVHLYLCPGFRIAANRSATTKRFARIRESAGQKEGKAIGAFTSMPTARTTLRAPGLAGLATSEESSRVASRLLDDAVYWAGDLEEALLAMGNFASNRIKETKRTHFYDHEEWEDMPDIGTPGVPRTPFVIVDVCIESVIRLEQDGTDLLRGKEVDPIVAFDFLKLRLRELFHTSNVASARQLTMKIIQQARMDNPEILPGLREDLKKLFPFQVGDRVSITVPVETKLKGSKNPFTVEVHDLQNCEDGRPMSVWGDKVSKYPPSTSLVATFYKNRTAMSLRQVQEAISSKSVGWTTGALDPTRQKLPGCDNAISISISPLMLNDDLISNEDYDPQTCTPSKYLLMEDQGKAYRVLEVEIPVARKKRKPSTPRTTPGKDRERAPKNRTLEYTFSGPHSNTVYGKFHETERMVRLNENNDRVKFFFIRTPTPQYEQRMNGIYHQIKNRIASLFYCLSESFADVGRLRDEVYDSDWLDPGEEIQFIINEALRYIFEEDPHFARLFDQARKNIAQTADVAVHGGIEGDSQ